MPKLYTGMCLPLEMNQRTAATISTARMTSQKSRPRSNSGRRNHIACPNPQNMGILSFSVFTFIFANTTLRYIAFVIWNNATYRYIPIYDVSHHRLRKYADFSQHLVERAGFLEEAQVYFMAYSVHEEVDEQAALDERHVQRQSV